MTEQKSKTWFVADTHFNHNLMTETRNFATVQDHDKAVAISIANTVRPNDTLVVLGDFCFGGIGKHLATMQLLLDVYNKINPTAKGYKTLPFNIKIVMGNHDMFRYMSRLLDLKLIRSLHGTIDYKLDNGRGIVGSHVPLHENCIGQDERHGWQYNIHGHIHDATVPDVRYLCVSWDHFKRPISLQEIEEKLEYNEKVEIEQKLKATRTYFRLHGN